MEIGAFKSESAHALKGERTYSGDGGGENADRHFRHAIDGGWFSYELNVLPYKPMELHCTYWGKESGARQV